MSLLAVLFLLSACSGSGKPSDSEIEKAVTTWFMRMDRNAVIKNFHKTNGYMDGKYYSADIEFVAFSKQIPGGKELLKGKAIMIKTEKGWLIEAMNPRGR